MKKVAALIMVLALCCLSGCVRTYNNIDVAYEVCGIVTDYSIAGSSCTITLEMVNYLKGYPKEGYFQHGEYGLYDYGINSDALNSYYFDQGFQKQFELDIDTDELKAYVEELKDNRDKISFITIKNGRATGARLTSDSLSEPVKYENNIKYELPCFDYYDFGAQEDSLYIYAGSNYRFDISDSNTGDSFSVTDLAEENLYFYVIDIDSNDAATELLCQTETGKNFILYESYDNGWKSNVLILNGELSFDGNGILRAYINEDTPYEYIEVEKVMYTGDTFQCDTDEAYRDSSLKDYYLNYSYADGKLVYEGIDTAY